MRGVAKETGEMNTTSSRTARAFTLTELLVVVAVTATLVAILLPVYTSAREKGRQATCTSNMRQIGTAMVMYAADNAQCLPPYDTDIRVPVVNGHETKERLPAQGRELIASLYPYAHSKEVWYCPDDGPPDVARDGRLFHRDTSYTYGGWRMAQRPGGLSTDLSWHGYTGSELALMSELCIPGIGGPWGSYSHSGRSNMLFYDGHVIAWPIHSNTYNYPDPW